MVKNDAFIHKTNQIDIFSEIINPSKLLYWFKSNGGFAELVDLPTGSFAGRVLTIELNYYT